MQLLKYLSISTFCATLVGCANYDTTTQQEITFRSKAPQSVQVTIDGEVIGKTPVSHVVERSREYKVTLSKNGYITREIQLKPDMIGTGKKARKGHTSDIDSQLAKDPDAIDTTKQQYVSFESTKPEGVQVKINGEVIGTTPCKHVLSRTEIYKVDFSKDEYVSRDIVLEPKESKKDGKMGHTETVDANLISVKESQEAEAAAIAMKLKADKEAAEAAAAAEAAKKAQEEKEAKEKAKRQRGTRTYTELKADLDEIKKQKQLNMISDAEFQQQTDAINAEIKDLYGE